MWDGRRSMLLLLRVPCPRLHLSELPCYLATACCVPPSHPSSFFPSFPFHSLYLLPLPSLSLPFISFPSLSLFMFFVPSPSFLSLLFPSTPIPHHPILFHSNPCHPILHYPILPYPIPSYSMSSQTFNPSLPSAPPSPSLLSPPLPSLLHIPTGRGRWVGKGFWCSE